MWGVIGFLSAAIVFALAAFAALNLKIQNRNFSVTQYGIGHILASATFLLWGYVLYVAEPNMLKTAVILGDIILIAASVLLAASATESRSRAKVLFSAVVIGLLFIALRLTVITPEPLIDSNILIFNPQTAVSIFLALIFISTWFRANMTLGKIVIKSNTALQDAWTAWYFINLVALIGFCGFIIGKKPQTVAFSFVALVAAYAIMSFILFASAKGAKYGK